MKTAIYIRVSTEEQATEGYSISAQMQKLKAFCISQGWDVAGIYPDEGISAKDMERPKLQEMIKDIKAGKIECVLVYRLDRLTRSVFDLYKMLEIFEGSDCKFKSATEVYDTTTAMGRMFITIVAALAQWERENMGERYAMAYKEKARQGLWPLNFAPIGYDLDKKDYVLKINSSEAETVKLIYSLYQQTGMNQIAKKLNSESKLTKDGNKWSDNTIMKVLRGHSYCGEIYWKGEIYKGLHDSIIDKKEWNATQELIAKRRGTSPRSVSSRYIFSGKLKCEKCGKSLVGNYSIYDGKHGRTEYPYYRCQQKKHGRCEGIKHVFERKIESAFIDYLDQFNYEGFYAEVVEVGEKKLNEEEEAINVKELERQLEKIEKRKKKWQYAWTEDVMSYEDFKERMEEAKAEEIPIKKQLESLTVETEEEDKISKGEIVEALKNIKENWSLLKTEGKKNLVNQIVKQIHYKRIDNKVEITRIDFL